MHWSAPILGYRRFFPMFFTPHEWALDVREQEFAAIDVLDHTE